MGKSIAKFLVNYKNKNLLAVFPHADDVPFVAGGLFQLLEKLGIETKLICLTSGDKEQLKNSCDVLGIDKLDVYDYKSGELREKNNEWVGKIKKEIENTTPFAILTFDPHGITGNVDHVHSSVSIFRLLKEMKEKRPELMWRISDSQEKKYFDKFNKVRLDIEPSHYHFLRLSESIKKLRAIFKHKNKFKSPLFRMRIAEWYLFDHKELYYLVDFSNNSYQIVTN